MRWAVLSTGRQDWGILRSTCVELRDRASVVVIAGGMACDAQFGDVSKQIQEEGFAVESVPWTIGPTIPHEREAASALAEIGAALRRLRPDALILVGDRYETAAATLAATLLSVPVVHLHGGEETEGAIDNVLRHSITKQASLHFVAHRDYERRLIQMGEAPSTVHVVGAPGLDNLNRSDLLRKTELESLLGLALLSPLVLVTVHPTTLGMDSDMEAKAVAAAMQVLEATYIVTLPNSDPGAEAVRRVMQSAGSGPRRIAKQALGERAYWSLLRAADAMLGNSSSGLIEAPAVALPVVNVGDRQAGRLRGANVIDVPADPEAILDGLRHALAPSFRDQLRNSPPLFGNGRAGKAIADVLLKWTPPQPPRKRFVDR